MHRAALLLFALPLAGCGGAGTNISVTADGEGGNVSISTDASGRTVVSAPGVNGSISLPRIDIDAEDFDVNGVKLYPGSTIRDFNLDATEGTGERDSGRVTIGFDAPAPLATVQAWFRDNMRERGFRVAPQGNGFAGTTDDGDPVTLELNADGADKTKGRMSIGA